VLDRDREHVAAAARRAAREGLVLGTAGNISERSGELVAITPTGAVLGELTAGQVAVVDLEGEHVDGEFAPTSELELHLGVYRRYEAEAVVHTHSPMGTALSCVLEELPLVHYAMLQFGGAVRVAPYATFGSRELADVVVDALHERSAALMANHGAVTLGPDVETALELSLLLEWACTVYWNAAQLGSPRALGPEQRDAVIETVAARGYGKTHRIGG
jgi:L-fuculose-phosphate aldolase